MYVKRHFISKFILYLIFRNLRFFEMIKFLKMKFLDVIYSFVVLFHIYIYIVSLLLHFFSNFCYFEYFDKFILIVNC